MSDLPWGPCRGEADPRAAAKDIIRLTSTPPLALRVTKIKGHSTVEMVARGTIKAEHKQGNDHSDLITSLT